MMGLLRRYKFDGNLENDVGGLEGLPNSTFDSYVDGLYGQAIRLTAPSHSVKLPHDSEISNKVFGNSHNFSVAGWIRIRSFTNYGIIYAKAFGASFSNTTAGLWTVGGNNLEFIIGSNVSSNPSNASNRLGISSSTLPNCYFHFANIVRGKTMEFWVNGELRITRTISLDLPRTENSNDISIGARTASMSDNSDFDVDLLEFYDHALSKKEIVELSKAMVFKPDYDSYLEAVDNIFMRSEQLAFVSAHDGSNYSFGSGTNIQQSQETGRPNLTDSFITKVSRIQSNVTQRTYVSINVPSPINNVRTISFMYYGTFGTQIRPYNNDSCADLYYLDDDGDWVGGGTGVNIPVPVNQWKKVTVKIVNRGTSSGTGWSWTILHNDNVNASISASEYWLFTEFVLVEGEVAGPYIESSRPANLYNPPMCSQLQVDNSPLKIETPYGAGLRFFGNQQFRTGLIGNDKNITISTWIEKKGETFGNDAGGLIVGGDYAGHYGIVRLSSTIQARWRSTADSTNETRSIIMLSSSDPDGWYHIACTYNQETRQLKAYRNGVLLGTQSHSVGAEFISDELIVSSNNGKTGSETWARFRGTLADTRIYFTVLSDDEVFSLYSTKGSIDNIGNVFAKKFTQVKPFVFSDGGSPNLVLNGEGEYGDTRNMPSGFVYEGDGIFSITSGSTTRIMSEFIPIKGNQRDQFEQYKISAEFRAIGDISRYYYMIACYDKNKQMINTEFMDFYNNTETFLSQPLVAGDQWAYFGDVSGWNGSGNGTYVNGMSFAYWTDNMDSMYVPLKYSRTHVRYLEVDYANNRVRLQNTWSGATLPVGTLCINSRSGATYSYIGASNPWNSLDRWDYRESAPTSTAPNVNSMRYATAYVRLGWLINRNSPSGTTTTQIKNIRMWHVEGNQQNYDEVQRLNKRGVFDVKEMNEVGGTTDGLISWYPLTQDTKDYAGSNDGTPNNLILSENGYVFQNGSTYIDLPNDLGYTNEISVFCMFKSLGAPTGGYHIIMGGQDLEISIPTSGELRSGLRVGGTRYVGNSGGGLNDGEWHSVGFTYIGGTIRRYIDSVMVGSQSFNEGNITTSFSSRRIGVFGSSSQYGTNGIIKDLRVYSKFLNEEEVKSIALLKPDSINKVSQTKRGLYSKGSFIEV